MIKIDAEQLGMLRNLWQSRMNLEPLWAVRDSMLQELGQGLRHGAIENVPLVRAKMDALEEYFRICERLVNDAG